MTSIVNLVKSLRGGSPCSVFQLCSVTVPRTQGLFSVPCTHLSMLIFTLYLECHRNKMAATILCVMASHSYFKGRT